MEYLEKRRDLAAALRWSASLNMRVAPITNDRSWEATTPD